MQASGEGQEAWLRSPGRGGRERLPLAEARRDPDEHGAAGSSRARALLGAGARARGSPGDVIVGTGVWERAQFFLSGVWEVWGQCGVPREFRQSWVSRTGGEPPQSGVNRSALLWKERTPPPLAVASVWRGRFCTSSGQDRSSTS